MKKVKITFSLIDKLFSIYNHYKHYNQLRKKIRLATITTEFTIDELDFIESLTRSQKDKLFNGTELGIAFTKIDIITKNNVEKFGWAVTVILPENIEYTFGYTTGLYEHYHHPEIFLVGLFHLEPRIVLDILNNAGNFIKEGRKIECGIPMSGFLKQNYDVLFQPMNYEQIKQMANTTAYYRKFCPKLMREWTAIHMILPDKTNSFELTTLESNQYIINLRK